jgi:hypothetical protein
MSRSSLGVKLEEMRKPTRNLSQDDGVPVDVLNGVFLLKESIRFPKLNIENMSQLLPTKVL